MRLSRPKPGWLLVAVLLAGGAAYGARGAWRRSPASSEAVAPEAPDISDTAVAPVGVRVRVQVLNATRTRGLARRGTRYLRARGFDVVETGTAREQLDSTLVLDRSGHAAWAGLVAAALGDARVEARPDSSRYLDVTVLLGASWRPPAEPLDP
jgi:hypothetical protein